MFRTWDLGTQALVVAARGLSSCGAQAPVVVAHCLGLVAPRHVGFSQTRDRTRVPCIGRQILNHWTTREVLFPYLLTRIPLCRQTLSINFFILRYNWHRNGTINALFNPPNFFVFNSFQNTDSLWLMMVQLTIF